MVERNCNALMALIISGILWGAYGFQVFENEIPCALCLLQRLGMLGVAFGALLNIKFGIRKSHYGLSLLSAVFGGFVALRQVALHVCTDDAPWKPFWGLSLYTWSLVAFASSIAYIACLMLYFDYKSDDLEPAKNASWWGRLAFFSIFFVALTNVFTTFRQCGLGDCG